MGLFHIENTHSGIILWTNNLKWLEIPIEKKFLLSNSHIVIIGYLDELYSAISIANGNKSIFSEFDDCGVQINSMCFYYLPFLHVP